MADPGQPPPYDYGMTTEQHNFRRRLLRRSALSTAGFYLALTIVMFLPAGIRWWRGWLFLLVFLAFMVLSAAYLWRANPDIFIARTKVHRGTKSWDKVLMSLILGSFFAIFPLAAFDARYGWSAVPAWPVVVGYALFTMGFAASTWVQAVNKFAEPSVRIQSERGQTVVDTGPYALVRHPLYLAGFFVFAGIPLALGSYWALIPVVVAAIVIVVRTVLEDRMLQNELEGYKDYASCVRYRLIPGIW
jgi:protein-S-isoprenylcysteine O-methyltransferase Ste14